MRRSKVERNETTRGLLSHTQQRPRTAPARTYKQRARRLSLSLRATHTQQREKQHSLILFHFTFFPGKLVPFSQAAGSAGADGAAGRALAAGRGLRMDPSALTVLPPPSNEWYAT